MIEKAIALKTIESMFLSGKFEFNSEIHETELYRIFEIEMPKTGTRQQFTSAQLEELQVIEMIRQMIMPSGRFIKKEGPKYRVLLPSENEKEIIAYIRKSDHKLKRAVALHRFTMKKGIEIDKNITARILAKQENMNNIKKQMAIMA